MAERLQKVMAEYGVASRRKSEEMIYAGKVKVNGRLVTEPGLKIDKDRDVIEVDGEIIKSPEKKNLYFIEQTFRIYNQRKGSIRKAHCLRPVKGNKHKGLSYWTPGL